MARAIEQIERDIVALEETVQAIATELHSAYTIYLTALGQAVRQQLILASYHLCTQGYPKAFLSLPFSQRQELQQDIRKLGQNAAEQLLAHIRTEEKNESQEPEDRSIRTEVKIFNSLSTPAPLSSNPMDLAQWLQNLEQAITSTLKMAARETNRLLQQAGILPSKLPPPVLEVALEASEASGEAVAGSPPNLLNLVIETENHQESGESSITRIIAIKLRLSEIEFADATVRAGRNQIRNLEVKARSLLREYLKKQQEREVAEAETAWRASWFDE